MKNNFNILIFCLFSLNAFADEKKEILVPCKEQIANLCSEASAQNDVRGILKCLIANNQSLSLECKQEIERFAKASEQTTPPGGGPTGLLGSLGGGAKVPMLIYEGNLSSNDNNSNKTTTVGENSIKLSFPLYKNEKDTYSMSLVGGEWHFGQKLILDSRKIIPRKFYKTEIGLQYSHPLERGRMFGVQTSFGYLGDKLDSNNRNYSVSANYSFPGKNNGYWVLILSVANNGPFGPGVPLPGFFYIYKTPRFTGIFGLPILSMQWTPIDLWTFSFSAFGPIIKSEVSYGAIDKIQYFSALNWSQQNFILSDRESKKDRLTLEEKNVAVGIRASVFKPAFVELRIGYAFDRSVYLGNGLFVKNKGRADLNSNWFMSWNIRYIF